MTGISLRFIGGPPFYCQSFHRLLLLNSVKTEAEVIFMNDMPVGLMMTLAEQEQAMRRFAALSAEERDRVVDQARQASSREEMQAIVQSLT